MITFRSEPTTANGIMLCINPSLHLRLPAKLCTYPDALVQLDLLIIVLFRIKGIETDVVVLELSSDLLRR